MSKLIWDETGKRLYETGVSRGVLYPMTQPLMDSLNECIQDQNGRIIEGDSAYRNGVAWNGLTAVTESPSGAEANPLYANDIKYLNLMSAEEFGVTIEAYTYPDDFEFCDGSVELTVGVVIGQQKRYPFGLCYRTALGNDVDGEDHGYKLHIIYGAMAVPSEKAYASISDSPEPIAFSWDVTTTPVDITGFKPSASITIDSTKVSAENLFKLETILYGTDDLYARLPLPNEIASLFEMVEV